MRFNLTALVVASGLLVFGSAVVAEPEAETAADRQTLAGAGVQVDGPSLLEFFRKRTLSPEEQARLQATVHRLGHRAYRVRARASTELLRAGRLAISPLKRGVTDADLEIARRAQQCLHCIEQGQDVELVLAAARALSRLKPAGAAEVLLSYLPFANDDSVIEAVQAALNATAIRRGQSEAVVLRALRDPLVVKRGAAGEALTRAGLVELRQATAKLLGDADPAVRLQVALAFVDARDKRGVPVLIALLADLPREKVWPAEEVLLRLAGAGAPQLALGGATPAARVRDAWAGWWRAKAATMDLARLAAVPRLLGYTLVVQISNNRGLLGQVTELGRDGKPRWEISNLRYPLDAQVLPRDRVLVAEYLDSRVTERNFKGDILWQKHVNMPIACERLPNGNTFIVARNLLLEVDPRGKEVFSHNRINGFISAGKRMRNGDVILITQEGVLTHLDHKGKEVKTFQVGQVYFFGGVEVLPNGRVLVPEYRNNRVAEYDARGKVAWEARTLCPTSAMRLPNGNTLVTSMLRQKVVELNREGKVIWQQPVAGRPFRARRR